MSRPLRKLEADSASGFGGPIVGVVCADKFYFAEFFGIFLDDPVDVGGDDACADVVADGVVVAAPLLLF